MKVDFHKLTKTPKPFALERVDGLIDVAFGGIFFKNRYGFLEIDGSLSGYITRDCDMCGEETPQRVDEKIGIIASDGLYSGEEFLDVVEFLEGYVDFEEIMNGEIESLKTLYFRCSSCKNL